MKNILIKYLAIFATLTIVVLSGCKRESKTAIQGASDSLQAKAGFLDILENYYKVQNTKVQGRFMFESMVPNNDPKVENTVLLGGNFYDEDAHARLYGGTISIGKNNIEPNSEGTYGFDKVLARDGLFGQNVTFTLTPDHKMVANSSRAAALTSSGATTQGQGAGSTPSVTATIYSPAAISITNVAPQTPLLLAPGWALPITWNTDPNNTVGVSIIAEYLPLRPFNQSLVAAGFNTPLDKSILVPDNGSTVIPWSFFRDFPQNGHIILWVARGNYTIATDGTYNYQVGGYSAAAVWDLSIPTYPLINGNMNISFNASNNNGTTSGTITGTPGSTVTVTANAGGSGYFTTVFNLPSIILSNNNSNGGPHTVIAVTGQPNGSTTMATFLMPASGSVSWSGATYGNFSGAGANGGGSISVQ